jgi:hypothetical protein
MILRSASFDVNTLDHVFQQFEFALPFVQHDPKPLRFRIK